MCFRPKNHTPYSCPTCLWRSCYAASSYFCWHWTWSIWEPISNTMEHGNTTTSSTSTCGSPTCLWRICNVPTRFWFWQISEYDVNVPLIYHCTPEKLSDSWCAAKKVSKIDAVETDVLSSPLLVHVWCLLQSCNHGVTPLSLISCQSKTHGMNFLFIFYDNIQ